MAFSGGVDSSLLLAAACWAVKETRATKPVLAVTFETRLHPHGDTAEAKALALTLGAKHQIIKVDEFSDSRILHNPKTAVICVNPCSSSLSSRPEKRWIHLFL